MSYEFAKFSVSFENKKKRVLLRFEPWLPQGGNEPVGPDALCRFRNALYRSSGSDSRMVADWSARWRLSRDGSLFGGSVDKTSFYFQITLLFGTFAAFEIVIFKIYAILQKLFI